MGIAMEEINNTINYELRIFNYETCLPKVDLELRIFNYELRVVIYV